MSNKAKIREEAAKLNPIDNPMFIQMAQDKGFCEETLKTLLSDPDLKVLRFQTEYPATNRQGRDARIDCLCELGDGRTVAVEVQKANNTDHQRRVRYEGALIDANTLDPGEDFKSLPDVAFVYIADFDIFGEGKCLYHISRVVDETGKKADNGFQEIYVNARSRDGSDASELMEVFTEDNIYSDKFPRVSEMKRRYKETEEGRKNMTATLEKIMKDERAEGLAEGMEKGMEKGRTEGIDEGIIRGMVTVYHDEMGLPAEEIAKKMSIGVEKVMDILKS